MKFVTGTASYRALGAFEKFKDVALEWSKDVENWQTAVEMGIDDIRGTDLGTFLAPL